MKIFTVLGARPQFIKAALVSKKLRKSHQEILIHTGQHYHQKLSDVFFNEMGIPQPDYNLGIGSSTHARQTGTMMIKIEELLVAEEPDLVLLYGDTNSTLAAALAAAKLNMPIAHIEAGPRMFDKSVPEEVNRIITDQISTLLFAPTVHSVENLKSEGLIKGVHLTGDVMLDNFQFFSKKAVKHSRILEELELKKEKYFLVTVHRARNTNSSHNLETVSEILMNISEKKKIVFPVHPRTEKYLKRYGLFDKLTNHENIQLLPPMGYKDMLVLTQNAQKIITDSGGLQKEAYFAKIPCITLDNSSAWPETVEDGWNVVAYENERLTKEKIIKLILQFEPQDEQFNVFGDGNSVTKIHQIISDFDAEREDYL